MTAILRHDETGVLYHESCVDVGDLASFSPAPPEVTFSSETECGECGEPLAGDEIGDDPLSFDDPDDDLDERQVHRADGD